MKKTNRMVMNILQNFFTIDGNKHVSGDLFHLASPKYAP